MQKSKNRKTLHQDRKYWLFIVTRRFNEITVTNYYTKYEMEKKNRSGASAFHIHNIETTFNKI